MHRASKGIGTPLSVLAKCLPSDIRLRPFPHVVIRQALDPSLYDELAAGFPPYDPARGGALKSNRYSWYPSHQALRERRLSETWLEFIQYHVSRRFFHEILNAFEGSAEEMLRHTSKTLELRSCTTAPRFSKQRGDVALDCQLVTCSPVVATPSRSRGPHIDREVALFAGLLYFRMAGDDSYGGDLVLYRESPSGGCLTFDDQNHVPDHAVEEAVVIPYEANTLVMFLNSPRSVHGVSPRHPTRFPRNHVNFLAELGKPAFLLPGREGAPGTVNAWYGNRRHPPTSVV